MSPEDYCREIEAYLCRKNEGHLIRIVGPAFEQVCGWALQGVPLKIAFRGIDQYCERYYAKGPRRRPVRIEFCEADVLDLFDNWRRAVGVPQAPAEEGEEPGTKKPGLSAHIERVVARLTSRRAAPDCSASLSESIDAAVRELDRLAADARKVRGEARTDIIDRLRVMDVELMSTAEREVSSEAAHMLRREADQELAPFAQRMSAQALESARRAAFIRLLRETMRLPLVSYE